MTRTRRPLQMSALLLCLLVCVVFPQVLFCAGGGEAEEPKISRHDIVEGVYVLGPDEWNGYTFVYNAIDHKKDALESLVVSFGGDPRTLSIIVNLDIYALSGSKKIPVGEVWSEPPIQVFFELGSSEKELFFWEPNVGWVHIAEYKRQATYPDTEIRGYDKSEQGTVEFMVTKWPVDDKDTAGG